jgi:hypothetical protein
MTLARLLDTRKRAPRSVETTLCAAIADRGRVVRESTDDSEVPQLGRTNGADLDAAAVPSDVSRELLPRLSKLDLQLVPSGTFHAGTPSS